MTVFTHTLVTAAAGIAFAAVTLTTATATDPSDAGTQPSAHLVPAAAAQAIPQIKVSAGDGWQDTQLTVTNGQKFTVSYVSGTWTVDYTNFEEVGPEGYPPDIDQQIYQGCKLNPDLPYALLLGRIGSNGPFFSVGKGGEFTADRDGTLALRIHDDDACLVDNLGHVEMDLSTPCDDVLFLGARGSDEGESGMGDVVGNTRDLFVKAADKRGVTVQEKPLDYPGRPVPELITEPLQGKSSVREGVKETKRFLTEQRNRCPTQKFVLVGYSQGAWVLGAALFESDMPKIAAIVLFGDPRFDPNKAPTGVLRPVDNLDRTGVVVAFRTRPSGKYLPKSVTDRKIAWSYCHSWQGPVTERHDIVCNFNIFDKRDIDDVMADRGAHFRYKKDGITQYAVNWLAKKVLTK